MEVESVKLACKNASGEDIQNLKEIIAKEKTIESLEEKVAVDFEFHHMLCVASKNPVYPLIMNSFEPIAKKYLKIFYSLIDESYIIDAEHIDIVKAIEANDEEEAVKVLIELLIEGEDVIRLYGGIKNE